jgi:hypothetical protein
MRWGGVGNGWQHRSVSRRAERVTAAIREITLDRDDSGAPEQFAGLVAAALPAASPVTRRSMAAFSIRAT